MPGEGCGLVAVSLCSWWIPLPQLLPLLLLLAGHRRNTLALPPEGTETRNVGTFKCIIEERGTRHVCSFSLTHSAVVTSTSTVCVCGVCVCVCKCTPNAFRFLQIAIIVAVVQQTKQK